MKGCCVKFANSIEPIWAGLRVIIGWWIRDIESRVLAGLGVILTGSRINDYCLLSSIGLIFASMNSMSWGVRELRLRNSHIFDVGYIIL